VERADVVGGGGAEIVVVGHELVFVLFFQVQAYALKVLAAMRDSGYDDAVFSLAIDDDIRTDGPEPDGCGR
jgi:hypothetical protein